MSTLEKRQAEQLPGYAKIRQMNRGSYDRDLAKDILDAGLVAHVAFIDGDRPIVIPMAYARIDDRLYVHGASTTRIVKARGTVRAHRGGDMRVAPVINMIGKCERRVNLFLR